MRNCREEFLDEVNGHDLLCAIIYDEDPEPDYRDEPLEPKAILKPEYSPNDLSEFIQKLNFEYDSGYGSQHVFGIIWYKDGTWSERGEYDGAEWWEYKSCPAIPDALK